MGYSDSTGRNADPSWSPDSRKIAFVSKSPSNFSSVAIWVVNADGSGGFALDEQPNPFDVTNYLTPRWAPNGSAIAFLSTENGNPDVVLKPLNGAAAHLISTPDNESDIAWSHDSLRIAFVRASGATRTIWVMNADASSPMSITTGQNPRWSPDDRYLLFDTSRDGNREVYRMNSNGTNLINLTNDPGNDFQAEWADCPH
jgi:Tol biopolymer transport system component